VISPSSRYCLAQGLSAANCGVRLSKSKNRTKIRVVSSIFVDTEVKNILHHNKRKGQTVLCIIVKLSGHFFIHCVSKNDTTQPPTLIFNSSCPIPVIFGINITEKIWHRKVVYILTSPVPCTYLTLGNFRNLKITKSAVKKHLFFLFENKSSYFHFICP